ncbi:hypothetical protein D3C77_760630 [compost metagenome]
MSTIKFIKKKPNGPLGNFDYIYECTCNNKKKHELTIPAANDNEAKQLAELECKEKCGEI